MLAKYNRLEGLLPLEEGLKFAGACLFEIINLLEEAYAAGDTDKIESLYTLFDRYTGGLIEIQEALEGIIQANMMIVSRRWGKKEDDVS